MTEQKQFSYRSVGTGKLVWSKPDFQPREQQIKKRKNEKCKSLERGDPVENMENTGTKREAMRLR